MFTSLVTRNTAVQSCASSPSSATGRSSSRPRRSRGGCARGAEEVLVHTGQHYDDALSRVFFDELALPRPEHRARRSAAGRNTDQTARMLAALEPLLAAEAPDVVLVYGDTNSTLAGALAAAQAGVPVAHVEAGMRSYDRTMPEELNRVARRPRVLAAAVLVRDGGRDPARRARGRRGRGRRRRDGRRGHGTASRGRAREPGRSAAYGVEAGRYLLATAHRAGNVDVPARLRRAGRSPAGACRTRSCCRCTRARARGCRPPAWTSACARRLG